MISIFVTGSSGFLGSSLVNKLLESSFSVSVFVRSRPKNILANVSYVYGDLKSLSYNPRPVLSALRNADVVLHCAGIVHSKNDSTTKDPQLIFDINTTASIELAKLAISAGVKRFVFLSTIGVHGINSKVPFSESSKINCYDTYTISKFSAEKSIVELCSNSNMDYVIIRPPLIYGPNAPGNFKSLLNLVSRSYPLPFYNINNKRSFIALDNIVDFLILSSNFEKSPLAANNIFLVSDCEDVSITSLVHKISRAYSSHPFLFPVPDFFLRLLFHLIKRTNIYYRLYGNLQVDSGKACDLLGWKPVVTMDEQLRKMADFDKASGKL